jgi:hypothetical protein
MGKDNVLQLREVLAEDERKRAGVVRPELGREEIDGVKGCSEEAEEGWQIRYLSAELVEEILYLCSRIIE